PSGDAALKVLQRGVDELAACHRAHDPAFGSCCRRVGENFELVPAIGALDRRTSLRNQSVVELVLSAAAAATYIHLSTNQSRGRMITKLAEIVSFASRRP